MELENAAAFEALMGEKVPGRQIGSGELEEGDCVALEVNLAWYPRLRLELSKDYYWAEYWFGEDNYRHLDTFSVTRRIAGHDLDGEGRGCSPADEQELISVLSDRPWVCLDQTNGAILACLLFYPDGETDIVLTDTWYSLETYSSAMKSERLSASSSESSAMSNVVR